MQALSWRWLVGGGARRSPRHGGRWEKRESPATGIHERYVSLCAKVPKRGVPHDREFPKKPGYPAHLLRCIPVLKLRFSRRASAMPPAPHHFAGSRSISGKKHRFWQGQRAYRGQESPVGPAAPFLTYSSQFLSSRLFIARTMPGHRDTLPTWRCS